MNKAVFILVLMVLATLPLSAQVRCLVFQSDFGTKDGAVAAMKGVAASVSQDLKMFDLTHEIPSFNIWEAAYRLNQTASYWPAGTVFVSVVDPGVGSNRKSVVAKTRSGHFFVTPDNGTLTLIASSMGIVELREIDESTNRLQHSQQSYTFHGRDVYAYTGARLAAGVITFEQVGKAIPPDVVRLPYQKPVLDKGSIVGTIDILDVQYGNVWTNIPASMLEEFNIAYGDMVLVEIFRTNKKVFDQKVRFGETFSAVAQGEPVAYLNSLLHFSLALNMGDFAREFGIGSGPEWKVRVIRQ